MDVFSFSQRRLLADVTAQINVSHSAPPPPALLVQWEVDSGLGRGGSAGAFSSFLLLYNNKLTVHGFVVLGWGISTTHMLRS